jgi:hypothetical protein
MFLLTDDLQSLRRDLDAADSATAVLQARCEALGLPGGPRVLARVEAADLILKGLNGAIASKKVTYDFARLMEGATEVRCSAFGDNMIAHM